MNADERLFGRNVRRFVGGKPHRPIHEPEPVEGQSITITNYDQDYEGRVVIVTRDRNRNLFPTPAQLRLISVYQRSLAVEGQSITITNYDQDYEGRVVIVTRDRNRNLFPALPASRQRRIISVYQRSLAVEGQSITITNYDQDYEGRVVIVTRDRNRDLFPAPAQRRIISVYQRSLAVQIRSSH